jgi:integrase/recombinase XerD
MTSATVVRTGHRAPSPLGSPSLVENRRRALLLSLLPADDPAPARLTVAWLDQYSSRHTRTGYTRDLTVWLSWCQTTGRQPLAVRRVDLDEYAAWLRDTPDSRGRRRSKASISRYLATLSSWYTYLQHDEIIDRNPVTLRRPRVDRNHSSTIGINAAEAVALIAAADLDPYPAAARTRALIRLLIRTGLRVDEACGLDVAAYGHERGHRTLRYTGKGDQAMVRSVDPDTADAIDAYLHDRAGAAGVTTGPLFATETGRRLDQPAVFRLVRRLARAAGIPAWARLSPHSLRHAFATIYLTHPGSDLRDLQDAMGHASPETTRRYDRDRYNLDRDPTYLVGAQTAVPPAR